MTKVYILVDNPRARNNYLPAEKFGELVIVYDHGINPTHLGRIFPELRERLRDFKEGDYVIATGPPALIAMAGYILMDKVRELNILTWDRETNDYYNVKARG